MKLTCMSGTVNAEIGERYTDRTGEWEIVRFCDDVTHSVALEGLGVRNVTVKPIDHPMPSWYLEYENDDGTLDLCGDSVAAMLLTKLDGQPRGSRGDILTTSRS